MFDVLVDELSSDSLNSLSSEAKYYLLYKQTETSTNLRQYVDSTDMLASIAIGKCSEHHNA